MREQALWADRYSRQTRFAPIGQAGQEKLRGACVLIVGSGALGASLAQHMTRAGVGTVRLADRDFVEPSNLQRQMLFEESDALEALPKAVAAANKLRRINSEVNVEPCVVDVTERNVHSLVQGADLVLDGTDNARTRLLLSDACFAYGIPLLYGGVAGAQGMSAVIVPGETACLRCLIGGTEDGEAGDTCDTVGVISPIVEWIAALQAAEALKWLSGNRDALRRTWLTANLWPYRVHESALPGPSAACPCCGAAGGRPAGACGKASAAAAQPVAAALEAAQGGSLTAGSGGQPEEAAPRASRLTRADAVPGEASGDTDNVKEQPGAPRASWLTRADTVPGEASEDADRVQGQSGATHASRVTRADALLGEASEDADGVQGQSGAPRASWLTRADAVTGEASEDADNVQDQSGAWSRASLSPGTGFQTVESALHVDREKGMPGLAKRTDSGHQPDEDRTSLQRDSAAGTGEAAANPPADAQTGAPAHEQPQTAALCGRDTVQVTLGFPVDLESMRRRLVAAGCTVTSNPYLIRGQLENGLRLAIFPDGRILVQGTQDTQLAVALCQRYVTAARTERREIG
jgi:adenylyltransferase/sulfurtransferase